MAEKTLILNASPRKHGLVSSMLSIIENTLKEEGAEVQTIDVCSLNVRPCIACMKCRTSGECCLPEDDAQRVLRLVGECDSLVIGTPCYWGNMNGQLKVLFDRWVYGMMGEHRNGIPVAKHKGKKAVIVSTSSTIWPWNIMFHQTSGAIRAVKEVIGWSGFKTIGTVQKGGTRIHQQLSEREKRKCERVAKALRRA